MLTSMSSGAILSKTRAMFGRRLTTEDYTALSQKGSVAEAALYLGNLPAYKDLLDGRDAVSIHRMELEDILRHRHFENFSSLCRYELSVGEKMAEYILLTTEIELISETLSRVMSPIIEKAVSFSASPFLDRRLHLDLSVMGRAQTYEELLEATKESVFYPVLKRLGWHPTGELVTYENALLSEFYRLLFELIDNGLSGDERDILKDIFISKIDLQNLIRVIRLKDYFSSASPEYIRTSLIPHGNVMKENAVRLAQCENSGSVLAEASKMKAFRKKLSELDRCRRIDELADRYLLKRCWHEIHFSPHPTVVMISYLHISEIEISNIIKIVEGIRYGLTPNEIMELLILPEDKKS
ncbi:MAG: hypothetical protein E7578_06150 [Ruminococcaceae bacterium]|nr:hypothetical protein [Oscillospiraceae bacterium]